MQKYFQKAERSSNDSIKEIEKRIDAIEKEIKKEIPNGINQNDVTIDRMKILEKVIDTYDQRLLDLEYGVALVQEGPPSIRIHRSPQADVSTAIDVSSQQMPSLIDLKADVDKTNVYLKELDICLKRLLEELDTKLVDNEMLTKKLVQWAVTIDQKLELAFGKLMDNKAIMENKDNKTRENSDGRLDTIEE